MLLWQTSQTINFAQGEFVMLPAFFVLIGTGTFGLPFWLAALLGGLVTLALFGLAFKKLRNENVDLVKKLKLNNNRIEALVDQMYGINRRHTSLE